MSATSAPHCKICNNAHFGAVHLFPATRGAKAEKAAVTSAKPQGKKVAKKKKGKARG